MAVALAKSKARSMRRKRKDDRALLAPLIKDYFDWSLTERKVSPCTIRSYRDAIVLFLRHMADVTKKRVEELVFPEDLASQVLVFLRHVENERGVSIDTRNHRLSVIKSFCRYVAYRDPLLAVACRRVTAIPAKKSEKKLLDYLEPEEMEASIDTALADSASGRRNRAMLLVLFNTGCRASEVANLKIADVIRDRPRHIRVLGKGRRWRTVPLWERTVEVIDEMLRDRTDDNLALFVGQRGNAITRYGVRYVVRKHGLLAMERHPALRRKRLSPHTVRHTTGVALLRATGDIDAVSKVLGHASLNTTRIYTAMDRSRIAETLAKISSKVVPGDVHRWRPREDLFQWLEHL
jgi:site-specific recombinase XerD